MTDRPTDLLTTAAQRIREGDHRIDIALCGPIAALLDEVAESVAQDGGIIQNSTDEAALAVARAVLGQDSYMAETE